MTTFTQSIAALSLLAQESSVPVVESSNLLTGLSPDQRTAILIIAIGCATGVVIALAGIYAGMTNALHRRNAEVELKRDMLDRGMSSDEIAQVIESTPPTDFLERWASKSR